MSETNNKTENKEIEENKNEMLVALKKPFRFEGKEYTSVDLSGMEELTGMDMQEVEKMLRAQGISSFIQILPQRQQFCMRQGRQNFRLNFSMLCL